MTDKAAIFTDLTKRNALRRAGGLPPLDIRAEYAYECALAAWKEWEAQCAANADLEATIRDDIIAELRKVRADPNFPNTMGARLLTDALVINRFESALAARGIYKPPQPTRYGIAYGETVAL